MFKGRYGRSNGASTSSSSSSSRGGQRGGHRGRGGRGRFTKKTGPRGLFTDGSWQCDCTPRMPAEHFKVKKEGANQGRWFYTCQKQADERCGFFLWDEDAKPREEAAVLSNSRNEPVGSKSRAEANEQPSRSAYRPDHESTAPTTPTPARRRNSDSTMSPSPPPPHSSQTQALKRKADAAGFDDDDDETFDWPLTAVEEEEMAKAADASTFKTPQKVQKTGVYATPSTTTATTGGRKLPWLQEPATPTSAKKGDEDYFTTPSKAPPASTASSTQTLAAPITPLAGPAPAPRSPSPPTRQRNALVNPADGSSTLTSEALTILSSTSLTPDVRESLRSALSKHDLKTQGIVKGRDITRLALKAKDAKIAELQARVASLEAEREVDRGVLRKLRWDADRLRS